MVDAGLTRVEGCPNSIGGVLVSPISICVHNSPFIISFDKSEGIGSGLFSKVFDRCRNPKFGAPVLKGKDIGITINTIVLVAVTHVDVVTGDVFAVLIGMIPVRFAKSFLSFGFGAHAFLTVLRKARSVQYVVYCGVRLIT